MGRSKQPRVNLQAINNPVTSRDLSWQDRVQKAWGSEYNVPDHNIYLMGFHRGFDSTDKGHTGIYGGVAPAYIVPVTDPYTDTFRGYLLTEGGDRLILSQNA